MKEKGMQGPIQRVGSNDTACVHKSPLAIHHLFPPPYPCKQRDNVRQIARRVTMVLLDAHGAQTPAQAVLGRLPTFAGTPESQN